MTSTTIYVAYHASGPHPEDVTGYRAICNVADGGARPAGFDHYDVENGLPTRNQAYCELSPLHALDIEADTEWIGLAHYRRLLVAGPAGTEGDRYPGFRRVRAFDWADVGAVGAGADQLLAAVERVDWASPVRLDVRRLGFASLWDQYERTHSAEQILVTDRIVGANGPARVRFSDYLKQRSALRPFNMLLARREIARAYFHWLWPVLDACYSEIGDAAGAYNRRWPGFLGERLLNYWLDVVQEGQVRERRLPVLLLHDATIRNSAHPAQGEQPGRARPRRSRVMASALAALPPGMVRPIARGELQRAVRAAHA